MTKLNIEEMTSDDFAKVFAEMSDEEDSSDSSDDESDWLDEAVSSSVRVIPSSASFLADFSALFEEASYVEFASVRSWVLEWGVNHGLRLGCELREDTLRLEVLDAFFDVSKLRVRANANLSAFRASKCSSLSAARAFWTDAEVSWEGLDDGVLSVRRRGDSAELCELPRGHERHVRVLEGSASSALNAAYPDVYENGVRKYRVDDTGVEQQCPCGKVECAEHVFPSTQSISSSFSLSVRKRKRSGANLESMFESLDCMTRAEALSWWDACDLKVRASWRESRGRDVLHLQLRCGCGKYHDVVPCDRQSRKGYRACVKCAREYPGRSLKDGLCQECFVRAEIDCAHCNKRVPRRHDCVRLCDEFVGMAGSIYPACRRSAGSNKVLCPDCQETMDYNVYHRHQYRRHCYLRPCRRYTRRYVWHKCEYCNYRTCDKSVLNTHMLTHMVRKQYACKLCDKKFSSPCAEKTHRQRVHNTMSSRRRRVMLKNRRIVTYESEDEIVHVI